MECLNFSFFFSRWVCKDGQHVYSGDGNGNIRFWDTKRPGSTPVFSYQIESVDSRVPISNIHLSPGDGPGEDGTFIGVNSYDNGFKLFIFKN